MKVFRVVTERDGETTREPGKTSTELVRETLLYAADTMQEVWDAIEWLRSDPERTLVELVEVAPAITVLTPSNDLAKPPGAALCDRSA